MKKILALLLLSCSLASAQTTVKQSGQVTPGHVPYWATNGVIADGGTAQNGFLTSLGTVGNTVFGQCHNSGPITGAYTQLCIGATSAGGSVITASGFGGASAGLSFNVGGTSYAFPFPAGGILGPGTTVVGDFVLWNNTIGTLVKDAAMSGDCTASSSLAITCTKTNGTAFGPGATAATNAALTLLCNQFTSSLLGCVPASGGGTTNFLRADGSWASPSAGALVITANSTITTGFTAGQYIFSDGSKAQAGSFGTGIATALGVNVGSAGAPVLLNSALGTPSSGTLTNATGLPWAGVISTPTTLTGYGITSPLPVAQGGTAASSASGTALDNITGFSSTGFLTRTGAGSYAFQSATNGISLGNIAQSSANTMLGNWTGSTANVVANLMPSCPDTGGNHLNYILGTGISCGNTSSGGGGGSSILVPPQGRLTLQSGIPVMITSQTAKTVVYYDCYLGNNVPYYNGSVDTFDTVSSCEVSTTMVSAASAGQVVNNNVYDIFWVHGGASRICIAMSAASGGGGGWSSDTAGSNTARGTGYSQIDRTRGYLTNTNPITNCFNGATNYGPVSTNQGTYLGTFYAVSNGQTSYTLGSAASGGGAANIYLWNAYNRVSVQTKVVDSNSSWTYALAPVHNTDGSASNRISWVTGLAEDGLSFSYFQQSASSSANAILSIGMGFDVSGSSSPTCLGDATTPDTNGLIRTISIACSFDPVLGLHFVQAQEATDGTVTAVFGGLQGGSYREALTGSLRQ